MARSAKVGFKAVLYYVGGTDESPTYTAFQGVSDCAIEFTIAELDASSRDSTVVETEAGMMSIAVTGKMRDDPLSAGYTELRAATLARTAIRILALDAALSVDGATGYSFDAKNFAWGESQGLGEVVYRTFSLKPCVSDWKKTAICTSSVVALTSIA